MSSCDSFRQNSEAIVALSREFGSDPRYVIAGGGNSSVKTGNRMFIKASGSRMATISPEGFAAMDLSKLSEIWNKTYAEDKDAREEAVLEDLMASRFPGEEHKRPSVETLLHALFPERFVMHTHPALVNGLTCSKEGRNALAELFGNEALWVEAAEPGYVLARAVREVLLNAGSTDKPIFLENHGVFITGNSEDKIRNSYAGVFSKLESRLSSIPDTGSLPADYSETAALMAAYSGVAGEDIRVLPFLDKVLLPFIKSREDFAVLQKPFTPDHIVYAGFRPMFLETMDGLVEKLSSYRFENGELPKVIALQEKCCYALGRSEQNCEDARDLFLDAAKIANYSLSFGGPSSLPEHLIDFIRTWEAEKYRQKQA